MVSAALLATDRFDGFHAVPSGLVHASGYAALSAFLIGWGLFLASWVVSQEIARWKGRFVPLKMVVCAVLLVPVTVWGSIISGYFALAELNWSVSEFDTLISMTFWLLISAGGTAGVYGGVKVGKVRRSALDYSL